MTTDITVAEGRPPQLSISTAAEQCLYSLRAKADDETEAGRSDSAALLRACAATLESELKTAGERAPMEKRADEAGTQDHYLDQRERRRIGAEDAYFKSRPEKDRPALRQLFEHGFTRGFDSRNRLALREIATDDELEDLRFSLRFYQSRVELLQQWQSKMRDPERTIACDIMANGQMLPDPHGVRYGVHSAAPSENDEAARTAGDRGERQG